VTAAANGSGPMVSPKTGRRHGSPPREQQSSDSILVSLPLCFKLFIQAMHVFLCNSRIHVITLYSGHACIVLYVNVSVLAPHMDPG
jgi:hypothetical protein